MFKINSLYLRNIVSSYFLYFIQMAAPLVIYPMMTQKLGNELFGIWVLFGTIIGYMSLGSLGFGTQLLQVLSRKDDKETVLEYVNTTLVFYMCVIALFVPLYIVVYQKMGMLFGIPKALVHEAQAAFALFVFMFAVNLLGTLFGTLLFARGMLYLQNFIIGLTTLLSAFAMVFLLYVGASLTALAAVYALFSLVSSAALWYLAYKKAGMKLALEHAKYDIFQKMLRPSLHYFVITASAMIIFYSDNLVISLFIGVGSLSAYALANKLVSMAQNILFKLVDIMVPDIAKLYEQQQYSRLRMLHNKMLLVSFTCAVVGYGLLFTFGSDFLSWWVGKQYTVDERILYIFLLFAFIHAGVHVSAMFLVAMGEHRATSYVTLLDASLNVVLSVILLQKYGLYGVAFATLVSHILTSGWFSAWWFYRVLRHKEAAL